MYSGAANKAKEEISSNSTAIVQLKERLGLLNARLSDAASALEQKGHRLVNTESPTNEEKKERAKPNGFLEELREQLDFFETTVYRLESLNQKLSELI